ncbi:hypothetical protein D6D03_04527 [Aureobasidium pullulans]|nr:hypothetical protein D6D03_04527 [Aureobasidium pullulans]
MAIAMTEPRKTKVLLYGLGAIGGFYAFILSRDSSVELSVVARSNLEVVKKNVSFLINQVPKWALLTDDDLRA